MIHSITLPGGARVHADSEGAGESVLFVHADVVDGRMWNAVRQILSPRYRTAAYDKQGYGRSDPATGPIVRRRELAAVVEALALGPVHLVGCSNGGLQALDFTLENPGLVRSLTLVNASPSGWQLEGPPPAPILAMIEAFQKGDLAAASELQLQIYFDGPERGLPSTEPLRRAREEAGRMNRPFVDRGTYFIADAQPAEPLDPPALSRLTEVRVPTLVIDGRADWSENRRASRILAEGIPGARRIEVDGAHLPPMEDPEGFARLWEEFLKPPRP